MSDLNKVILTGYVGQEPEFKYFDSGAMLTNFSIAVKRYDTKNKTDITEWFSIKTFSKLGEFVKKGQKIIVGGCLRSDSYEKDGEKKKVIYVMADDIQILTPKEK